MMKLIIFDIDGTLMPFEHDTLMPGVAEWFAKHGPDYKVALVSNQGGYGLRCWMESGNFGDPSQYPTEGEIRARIQAVQDMLPVPTMAYVCFAYESKKSGKWAPVPVSKSPADPEWMSDYRKPAPGMLIQAMRDHGCAPEDTLMVGDGVEDEAAAIRAGCDFAWAKEFFGRCS